MSIAQLLVALVDILGIMLRPSQRRIFKSPCPHLEIPSLSRKHSHKPSFSTESHPSPSPLLTTRLPRRRRSRRKATIRIIRAQPSRRRATSRSNGRVPARGFEHAGHVVAQLGHGRGHLLGEDVAKGSEGVDLAAHELVAAADELDELAGVNVRVAAVFDVLEEFGGDGGEVVWRGGGGVDGLEGVGEVFAFDVG